MDHNNSKNHHILTSFLASHCITVTAAWKEPLPGWVDNLNGPTGILVGAGKGVIRTMHCNSEFIADVVPVDVSVNSMILIAWKSGAQVRKDVADVYNITVNSVSIFLFILIFNNF